MKTVKLFVMSALLVVMASCGGNSPKELIVGKWQVTDIDLSSMLATVPEEQKAFVESMIPKMEEAMKTMVMTFEKDGNVTTKATMMGDTREDKGTYKISEDGKKLSVTTNSKTEEMDIESISKGDMVVSSKIEGNSIKMTLKKK